MKLDVTTVAGGKAGSVEVPDAFFGIAPNHSVMHQVVTAQLAAAAGDVGAGLGAAAAGGGRRRTRAT